MWGKSCMKPYLLVDNISWKKLFPIVPMISFSIISLWFPVTLQSTNSSRRQTKTSYNICIYIYEYMNIYIYIYEYMNIWIYIYISFRDHILDHFPLSQSVVNLVAAHHDGLADLSRWWNHTWHRALANGIRPGIRHIYVFYFINRIYTVRSDICMYMYRYIYKVKPDKI